jgi:hypothetical protein
MEAFGDQLLASAALPNDEHRPVERRGTTRPLDRVEEREALPNELFCSLHKLPTVGGKSHHLARNFRAFPLSKMADSLSSGLSAKLARLLYGNGQV